MDLHPDLAGLAFLIGEWEGSGTGQYPNIESFGYRERLMITPLPGKPVLSYAQRTQREETGESLHSEVGFLRPGGAGRVELVLAAPLGIVEVHAGTVEGTHVHLRSLVVAGTPTAIEVTDIERHIEVEGHSLGYRLSMAAMGQPLQVHLEATLSLLQK